MALRTNTRRLSMDFIHRAASDLSSSDGTISKHINLGLPSYHHSGQTDVVKAKCDCCSLAEDCTRAYERRVRGRFCGRWLCGLCSEAVKEEMGRLGLTQHIVREEALSAHMDVCKKFNKCLRINPAMFVAGAMADILKKSSKRGGCRLLRTYSAIPSLGK